LPGGGRGGLGPKRLRLAEDGKALPPPYRLVPNDCTGLAFTDLNAATTLQKAMNENKFLKVFVASGFYDMDTSYLATKYTANNLNFVPGIKGNITLDFYDAGHQMYTHLSSLKKLNSDVASFFKEHFRSLENNEFRNGS
jgi:carboxypeptidase C (cathepsin A)